MAVNKAAQHADCQRQGKALDRAGAGEVAEPVQDQTGDQGRDIAIPDRRPGVAETFLDRAFDGPTEASILLSYGQRSTR